MKSIYEYLDYRQYLKDYYANRKVKDLRFSYRVWADEAGFKAKDFIFRVMRGGSRLSGESTGALTKSMDFSKSESRYFKDMVSYNQAKTFEEREAYYARLHRDHVRFKPRASVRVMPYDHFEFYSEWYHAAIRSLISSYGFTGDYKRLARMVYPSISVSKARKSVMLLEKLGLIRKNISGSYSVTQADIDTGDEVKRGALSHFYAAGMVLMKKAMEKLPMDKRNISGVTIGISGPSYQKIIDKVRKCRREVVSLAREDSGADRVYQLNFHLFPLSDVKGGAQKRYTRSMKSKGGEGEREGMS
jgi:uncharacterized protein (TIGR02147 family)